MVIKKGLKKGLKRYTGKPKLTNTQKEILHLITDEFLSIEKIALQRETSIQAVYKIVKKLRVKGALTLSNQKVEKSQGTYQDLGKIRLHGQEFNIRILWQDQYYQKNLRKSNIIFIDGNTIKLYRNSVEIYSGQSFFGKNERESDSKSKDYFNRFFRKLENDLKVILVKNRTRNIKEVKHEYAYTDSEVYENAKQHKERIWIYAEEDGKLAFITDNSFDFNEDETVHPETAKQDRGFVDKQINDWRLNNPPTNSELSMSVNQVMKELPPIINKFKIQIESHLKLIQEYRKENVAWRKNKIKDIKKELKYGKQTKLDDFF